ncbi:nuclear transport factor 2 family protein [Flavobacterium sp. UMI-01]|uniref:nuclear transport factor 2 family protein n=1 Tax=Flavobacterium sp. UMI-01 TaxID=1441053 RepID=UPI001C7D9D2C|nr:nuclear transport factor 2 family protein [Flavobacterium sp. UMI-01]GIZ07751.1 hypothetical protein FUMI01_04780 [Flavobacterium sp. UMI-01]
MAMERLEIEKLEYHLIEAIKNSDLKFLDEIIHDDLVGILPNGDIIDKHMDLASHRAGHMIVEKLIPNIEKISLIDDCVLVIITYDTKGMMLGTPIEGKFKYNRVWKKKDEKWKIISVSCLQV